MNPRYAHIRKRVYRKTHKSLLLPVLCLVLLFLLIPIVSQGSNSEVNAPVNIVSKEQRGSSSMQEQTCPLPTASSQKRTNDFSDTSSFNTISVPKEDSSHTEVIENNDIFHQALFIGDSRTEGLELYSGLKNTVFYVQKGLNVESIFTKKIVKENGSEYTIPEALQLHQFPKVYIMLGINELGWQYSNVFIQKYGQLLDLIQKYQPNATIYVQSILPVSKEKSETHPYLNNPKILEYNRLLRDLARKKGVRYLDVSQAVKNSEGYLPQEASVDGIHLNAAYCAKWLSFLRTHP